MKVGDKVHYCEYSELPRFDGDILNDIVFAVIKEIDLNSGIVYVKNHKGIFIFNYRRLGDYIRHLFVFIY